MTDFSKYLITTDLDGTFFGPDTTLVERNLKAIKRFTENGGKITAATGRGHTGLEPMMGDPKRIFNAPVVVVNGAYLYDLFEDRAYHEHFMSRADVEELLAFGAEHFPEVQFRVFAKSGVRVPELTGYLLEDSRNYDRVAVTVSPVAQWSTDDWYKIVYRDKPQRLAELRGYIAKRFGDRLLITSSGAKILEIQSPGVDKGIGIQTLREMLAAREGYARTLIACGDYENDVEMLTAADISVCPENALPIVKEVADYTLCHHADGLIADIVERIERGELMERKK